MDMASFNDYEYVFTPLRVGRQVLKNRIIFSPMVSDYTTANGEPTQGYIDFVEEQARTGAALITLGATPVNWDTAPDYPAELNVTEDTRINGLVLLSEVAHRHGAKISVELVHAGRGVHPELIQSEYGLRPRRCPFRGSTRISRRWSSATWRTSSRTMSIARCASRRPSSTA